MSLPSCAACSKAIPQFVGGPIALTVCPHCKKPLTSPTEGAIPGARPEHAVRFPKGIERWYTPGAVFQKGQALIDSPLSSTTCVLLRTLPASRPWPELHLVLRADSPDTVVEIGQAIEDVRPVKDPILAPIRQFDSDGSVPFLTYDLPEGRLLSSVVASGPVKDARWVGRLVKALVEGLVRVHEVGISASDLDPGLVVVGLDGSPLLLGAGLGGRLVPMAPLAVPPAEVPWLPPELLQGQRPTPSADVFRLGQVVAALFLGRPVTADDLGELEAGRGPLTEQPSEVRDLLRATLHPDPALRLESPTALSDVIRSRTVPPGVLAHLTPVTARPVTTPASVAGPAPAAEPRDPNTADSQNWSQLAGIRGKVDQGIKAQEVVLRRIERIDTLRRTLWRATLISFFAACTAFFVRSWPTLKYLLFERYPPCAVTLLRKLPAGNACYRAESDGAELVLVPRGQVTLGITIEQAALLRTRYAGEGLKMVERETPPRTVTVAAFLIDRFEVTNDRYKKFLEHVLKTKDHARCHPTEPRGHSHTPRIKSPWAVPYNWIGAEYPRGMGDRPVVLVDWYDAYAYAAWAGLRLPTDVEWERAARGDGTRHFPWGDSWETKRANSAERLAGASLSTWTDWQAWVGEWKKRDAQSRNYGTLLPVGAFPDGASPFGALDMAGNVWEWVWDDFEEGLTAGEWWSLRDRVKPQTAKVARGGSWCNFPLDLRVTRRASLMAKTAESYLGFRCARDAP